VLYTVIYDYLKTHYMVHVRGTVMHRLRCIRIHFDIDTSGPSMLESDASRRVA